MDEELVLVAGAPGPSAGLSSARCWDQASGSGRWAPGMPWRTSTGRNSDNDPVRVELGWEPSILLRDGMERTHRWIHEEYFRAFGD